MTGGLAAMLLMVTLGVAHIWIGVLGIDHHLGGWAAGGAVAVGLLFRIMLPLTIGTYFGVVDVIGWPWWAGVLAAAPGIVFIIPGIIAWFVAEITNRFR